MSQDLSQENSQIGTLNEKPLHAALKEWYAQPGDLLEVPVDGYIIDIVRGDLLVEIQTRSFSRLRKKLEVLTNRHPVHLVHPVAQVKWIVKLGDDGHSQLSRRKSPKRGQVEDIFAKLVSFPQLIAHSHFSLEVLLIQEDELRRHDPTRGWRRRGWMTVERHLLRVVGSEVFETPQDLGSLLPLALAEPFTTADLASALSRPRRLAQQMAYCLREMGIIVPVDKHRNAILYERAAD
jgi:hypothetical protein